MIAIMACIALIIFLITGKRLALVSSIGFFVVIGIEGSSLSYERAVISLIILNLGLFTVSAIEYKTQGTQLSRFLMWLYLATLLVTFTFTFATRDGQGYLLTAMAVVELLALATLNGCRSVWGDLSDTADNIRDSSLHLRDKLRHKDGK